MENWSEFGYTPAEVEAIIGFTEDSSEDIEEMYIESRRRSYYLEYCAYVRDNGDLHYYI